MTIAALFFGILVSTMMGAALHLLFGGGLGRLLIFVFMGCLGFWAGHFLGGSLGWTFWSVGPLRFGAALLGGAAFLMIAYWLSLTKVNKE
jgi:hypothetical protein